MTPASLLAEASRILDEDLLGPAGPRAVCFLVRNALEDGVTGYVESRAAVSRVPFRVVLLCLRRFHPDPEVGARAAATWNGLSRACHAYGNELPPPEDMVRAWIGAVEALGTDLARSEP